MMEVVTSTLSSLPAHKKAKRNVHAKWFENIFYDKTKKEFLALDSYGDWFPVNDAGLKRHCKVKGMETSPPKNRAVSDFEEFSTMVQCERPVAYAGPLAGHLKGPREVNGSRILVTVDPRMPDASPGPWPMLAALIDGLFLSPEHDQRVYLFGWLQSAIQTMQAHRRKPGQVLVMAGPVKSGKSLFQKVITQMLGGRECRPYSFMTNATDFNSDMFGSEHLRLDDENGSTDIRARRHFAAKIKELLFGHDQRMHAKHKDALMLDPVWRMSITLNEEPENMQVLPPLDDSLEDKLMILRAARKPMPMPTTTTEEEAEFWNVLMRELPHFVHYLLHEFQIPDDLQDTRCGVRHWHHPDLLQSIRELSQEVRFLSIIDRGVFSMQLRQPWTGTANDLESELMACSEVRSETQRTLSFNNACGTFLGRLAKLCPSRVEHNNTRESRGWIIHHPA